MAGKGQCGHKVNREGQRNCQTIWIRNLTRRSVWPLTWEPVGCPHQEKPQIISETISGEGYCRKAAGYYDEEALSVFSELELPCGIKSESSVLQHLIFNLYLSNMFKPSILLPCGVLKMNTYLLANRCYSLVASQFDQEPCVVGISSVF